MTTNTNNEQWWQAEYLLQLVMQEVAAAAATKNQATQPDPDRKRATARAKSLAGLICASKRYHVISDWYCYYKARLPKLLELGIAGKVVPTFKQQLLAVYSFTCAEKGKLLIGTKSRKNALWLDTSAGKQTGEQFAFGASGKELLASITAAADYMISQLHYFSGDLPQAQFDRLLFPQLPQDWPIAAEWTVEAIHWVDSMLASADPLNFPGGKVAEDEFAHILSTTYLDQSFCLVEGRPVLVRLEKHPVIFQLVLMKKEDMIFSRIETHRHRQIMHRFSLTEPDYDSSLDYFKSLRGIAMNENLALTAFVATIYRDLVVAEKTPTRLSFTKGKPKGRVILASTSTSTSGLPSAKPNLLTTHWTYIPRRKAKAGATSTPQQAEHERTPVSEAERARRERIKHWYMVRGHIRQYRDKADWQASDERQAKAREAGVSLLPGQTYIAPHARNLDALADTAIDESTLPHYLRIIPKNGKARKKASNAN